ncbi:superinfection immunity protein [Thermobacillus sp. ZCTH02-B1]|uniref:superinfection immunity protein n=1 Tax=Thermobacillus sp. ZCTH02-B1 TaxID=1858795 RepID=UPI0025DAECD1|nr:superinfection immunity protein [Thermobacillus sp. ZCTH02-B1]
MTVFGSVGFVGIMILLVLAACYFLPAIVAIARDHEHKGVIFLLNLLLGWSFIGWIILLIWAFRSGPAVARY